MSRMKDPAVMTRDELLHELDRLEAGLCQAPAGRARSGSAGDLLLELRLLKAATPSP